MVKCIFLNYKTHIFIVIVILFCFFPLFHKLGYLPVRQWDESRLAGNMYEMLSGKHFIVVNFEGKPDMWNTKPPLFLWIQTIFAKFFGFNEKILRLPSAFFGLLTCIIIGFLSYKISKNYFIGIFSSLILVTFHGFVTIHGTRTGDYDSFLTLLISLIIFCFYNGIILGKTKYFIAVIYLFLLACFTKGIAGLLVAPSLFFYLIFSNKSTILIDKNIIKNVIISLFLILFYYFFRESINPGYIKNVINNEITGRYFEVNEGHKESFWFYFKFIYDFNYNYWVFCLFLGIIIGFSNYKNLFKPTLFLVLISLSFLLILSFSKTKLSWYLMPVIPFLSILASFSIFPILIFFEKVVTKTSNYALFYKSIMSIFLILSISFFPYYNITKVVSNPVENWWEYDIYEISYFLREKIRNSTLKPSSIIVCDWGARENIQNIQHIIYYKNMANLKGLNISIKTLDELNTPSDIIVFQEKIKKRIRNNFLVLDSISEGKITQYKIALK